MSASPEAPVEAVDTSEGVSSAFPVEATQFPCSQCKGLVYSLSNENHYYLHFKNSQEVPVRINIVLHTSKEELITGGHREEEKPNFLGFLALHMCLLRAISISLEGGVAGEVAGMAQEQREPQTGRPLCLSRTLCPARGRSDSSFLASCSSSGTSSLTGKSLVISSSKPSSSPRSSLN